MRDGENGSVLIEGVLATGLCVLALVANVELVRRSYFELLLQHGAFLAVRSSVLSRGLSREETDAFWSQALGPASRSFGGRVRIQIFQTPEARVARVHFEVSALMPFSYGPWIKRKFEVTRRCHFACSL